MKRISMAFILILAFSVPAAAANKICFWVGGDYGAKGDMVAISASPKVLKVKIVKGDGLEGVFKVTGSLNGRDGKKYLVYDMGSNDGWNHAVVNAELVMAKTQGLIKFRNRGEGYIQTTFLCRDNK